MSTENTDQEAAERDRLLLRLLRTPPQPRPKRERDKSVQPKRKKPKHRKAKDDRKSSRPKPSGSS